MNPAKSVRQSLILSFILLIGHFICSGPVHAQSLPTKALVGLESPKERVRIVSMMAIRKSKDRRARRIIEGMLTDASPAVRAAAAENLGAMGDRQAVPALQKALKDASPLVKKNAKEALAQLTQAERTAISTRGGSKRPSDAIPTEVSYPTSSAPDFPGHLLKELQQSFIGALMKAKRRSFAIEESGVSKGYGLRLSVQTYRTYKQQNATIVEVQCRLNLVRLPGNTLRLSAKATAGVGIEGSLTAKEKAELTKEAILQCAPELAKDYEDYAFNRIR